MMSVFEAAFWITCTAIVIQVSGFDVGKAWSDTQRYFQQQQLGQPTGEQLERFFEEGNDPNLRP